MLQQLPKVVKVLSVCVLLVFLQKMAIDVSNLKNSLKDEVSKLKGHVTLDINLERGRALEAVSFHLQNVHLDA